MEHHPPDRDKPASNLIPFMVIAISFAASLYALVALPGFGGVNRGTVQWLRDAVRIDYAVDTTQRTTRQ